MNTTTTPNPNRSALGGIHRGVWIGGGLMALTIIALATTLVVKNNDALPEPVAATPAPVVADATPAAAPVAPQSSIANESTLPVTATPAPVQPVTPRPVHHPVPPPPAYRDAPPQQVAAAPVCESCGVIEGYSAVKVQGQNNGVGAVAGGLGGALVGSQIAGRGNHTLGGVIGAVGGGLLGNAIESHQRTYTVYDVRVRMADGSVRTVRQSAIPAVGQRVNVEGHVLHPIDGQG